MAIAATASWFAGMPVNRQFAFKLVSAAPITA